MPSPFPGMDPWLEDPDIFPDLHDSLIFLMKEALNALPGYIAISNRLIWTEEDQRRILDVSLLNGSSADGYREYETLPGLVALAVEPHPELHEEKYLEIKTDRGDRLVTAIEVLSPSNKVAGGDGHKAYLAKQQEFRSKDINLVEIDLLRAGKHTTAIPLERLETIKGPFDYHIAVTIITDVVRQYATTLTIQDRLPAIGIPLDQPHPPAVIDLQQLLNKIYDSGRYKQLAKYQSQPKPPLTKDAQQWASTILNHEQ
jgi:hypothetical protein